MAATQSPVGIRHVTVVPTNYDPAEETGEPGDGPGDDARADRDRIVDR